MRRLVRHNKVIADDELAAGTQGARGLLEVAVRVGAVHERLDGEGQVRLSTEVVGHRQVVAVTDPHAWTGRGTGSLSRTDRQSLAPQVGSAGREMVKAGAETAPEVDDERSGRRQRCQD